MNKSIIRRNAMNKSAMRKKIMLMILVLTAVCLSAGTVMGRSSLSRQELEAYYREKEQALVADTRAFLDGEGFLNSGVMLTRVLDLDGSRVYTLTVHHGKIDKMCEEDRELLMMELEKMVFEDTSCTFEHEFLINQ